MFIARAGNLLPYHLDLYSRNPYFRGISLQEIDAVVRVLCWLHDSEICDD